MIACSKLTTKLQNIKDWQTKLTLKASEISDGKNDLAQKTEERIAQLGKFYGARKEFLKLIHEVEILFEMERAEKLIGPENFYGPKEVNDALGIEIDPADIPPIRFSVEELKRARRNEILILRVDKTNDGEPLTIKAMEKIKKVLRPNSYNYNTSLIPQEDAPKLSWALVTKESITGSKGKSFIKQTALILKRIFRDVDEAKMPKKYLEVKMEFENKRAEILVRSEVDLKAGVAMLAELKATKLFRRTPVEIAYDLSVTFDNKVDGFRMMRGECDISSMNKDEYFYEVGQLGVGWVYVTMGRSDVDGRGIGACVSRRSVDL